MAKNSNNNRLLWVLVVSVAGLILTVSGIIWASSKGYTTLEQGHANQGKELTSLKGEGCLPARENKTDVAVIDQKLTSIQKEQTAGFKAIMDRLDEK